MSFKDKKPEFFRMGSSDNLVYSVGAVDEYLAIVEPMAEKYDAVKEWWTLFNQCIDSEAGKKKLEKIIFGEGS